MNRDEFIRFTNEATGIPMRHIDEAIDIFTDAITGAVEAGHDVKLVGFGSFKVKKSEERVVTDPRTAKLPESERKMMTIPAKKVVKFEPGTKLKAALGQ